ncbi:hypothetical protein H6F75_04155 [Nodosilinea sp. FACHB-131]|uniref:hypothetical protein n=1 Tax=Cyanophyceae TaxID=3028117 RepID=UPI00168992FD|nr:hypothetical protein [Nodosilinea sp. FACHB-131]MBD1872664.1 hypothetical protein [Nodosilinea sp. FACHB-131]
MPSSPPRIYCLPATDAPVVAVFRRGPSQWAHVGRWDLAQNCYEPGGWLRGRIFPRRSDISPDGRWLCYFAHNPKARWEYGEAYVAVSKLPWLTALHAFATCGTWTRGYYFTTGGSHENSKATTLPIPYDLTFIPVEQFANERRRGWLEAPDSPPRSAGGPWDENRNARLQKPQPGGRYLLRLESLGRAGGEFGVDQAVDGLRVVYALESEQDIAILNDVQWADWAAQGQLLVATRSGKLQVRELQKRSFKVIFEADLSALQPEPMEAPDWAQRW